MLNTTAFTLAGQTIVSELGTVRGIVVRSRSVIGNIGANIQTLFGGDITLYTELCERARRDAFERMCSHAAALGANAIVGVRYDATDIAAGVTEVLCYGTAVKVVAQSGNPPPLA
ncbi:MAG: YbjQ family protein [Opitutaceae bacterium]